MAGRRTIAVVTGSRAEFGLLTSTMHAIRAHKRLRLRTVVAGLHLTTGTWRDVRDAGFAIDAKVRMQKRGAVGRAADVRAVGRGVCAFGDAFAAIKPDVVLVLGDRIEVMAAATAAAVGGIHLAHMHGGDRAEGVADEAIRHAVSKLAHIHLPATKKSAHRLVRMGEDSRCVTCVGSPAVDGLDHVVADSQPPAFVVAQHPIGATNAQEKRWMNQTLNAVWRAMGGMGGMDDDAWCFAVGPNGDPGSDGIALALDLQPGEGHVPRLRFLELLAGAKAIVGNSSAGLIEAAALRVPCVNIGPRQGGRERAGNVVDCDYGEDAIYGAIRRALRIDRARLKHPYGDGQTGSRVAELLADVDLGDVALRKRNGY